MGGAIGAFLFIVTGYLGYVEAINHTHDEVQLPEQISSNNRQTCNVPDQYGTRYHPLGLYPSKDGILKAGFPVVQDEQTGTMITSRLFDRILDGHSGNFEGMEKDLKGRTLSLQLANHSIQVKIHAIIHDKSSLLSSSDETIVHDEYLPLSPSPEETVSSKYIWWTKPDLHHIGIFNALVFFISTILFWIPALAWWPMDALGNPTLASEIFWVYILQIVPSMGFIFVGHAAMAEASGSWIIPDFHSIGWWISLFNTIGGYGFFLYPVLYLPAVVEPGCCQSLAKWGAAMATFWGSCCFWIAGTLQCIEFSSEHPISMHSRYMDETEKKIE